MREIRLHGSEGGGADINRSFLPLFVCGALYGPQCLARPWRPSLQPDGDQPASWPARRPDGPPRAGDRRGGGPVGALKPKPPSTSRPSTPRSSARVEIRCQSVEIRCQFVWKSGVGSSFLPETMNRHWITRPSLPGPRSPSLSEGLWRRYNVMIGRCSERSGNIASSTTRRPLRRPLSRHDRRW